MITAIVALWILLAFIGGLLTGICIWAVVVAKDGSLVKLKPDEQIIKRPHPNLILVQVTPEIARRLVNTGDPAPKVSSTEARALYPERAMRSKANASPVDDALQEENE